VVLPKVTSVVLPKVTSVVLPKVTSVVLPKVKRANEEEEEAEAFLEEAESLFDKMVNEWVEEEETETLLEKMGNVEEEKPLLDKKVLAATEWAEEEEDPRAKMTEEEEKAHALDLEAFLATPGDPPPMPSRWRRTTWETYLQVPNLDEFMPRLDKRERADVEEKEEEPLFDKLAYEEALFKFRTDQMYLLFRPENGCGLTRTEYARKSKSEDEKHQSQAYFDRSPDFVPYLCHDWPDEYEDEDNRPLGAPSREERKRILEEHFYWEGFVDIHFIEVTQWRRMEKVELEREFKFEASCKKKGEVRLQLRKTEKIISDLSWRDDFLYHGDPDLSPCTLRGDVDHKRLLTRKELNEAIELRNKLEKQHLFWVKKDKRFWLPNEYSWVYEYYTWRPWSPLKW
jgi:hypothetical protein